MPWTAADAKDHTDKADTPKKQKVWAEVANKALDDGDSEASAIKQANSAVANMGSKDEGRSMPSAEAFAEARREVVNVIQNIERAAKKGDVDGDDNDTEDEENVQPENTEDDENELKDKSQKLKDKQKDSRASKEDPDDPDEAEESDKEEKDEDKKKGRVEVLTDRPGVRFFDPEPRSYNPSTREADAVISTGSTVRRREFWTDEEWDEKLDMGPKSIRLDRLNAGAALLDSHQWFGGIDSMLGSVVPGTARVEGGKLVARFRFSQGSEKAKRVAQDLQDGIPIHLSAGYKTYREVRDTTTSPETRTAVDWEPIEVSVAPVPAEGVGAGFRQQQIELFNRRAMPVHNEGHMVEKTSQSDAEGSGKSPGVDEAKLRAEAAEAERNRTSEILAITRQGQLASEFAEAAIKEGKSVEQVRKEAFEELAKRSADRGINGATGTSSEAVRAQDYRITDGGRIVFGRDARDGQAEAMVEAMTVRILASQRQPAIRTAEQAEWAKRMGKRDEVARAFAIYDGHEQPTYARTKEYLHMGWSEIAAECVGYRGPMRTPAQAEQVLERAYDGWQKRQSGPASLSTSDFPNIFLNVLNKTLLARYQLAMPSYREIAVERPFNDFRAHPQIRAGDFPQLQTLTETGEIRHGITQDLSETVTPLPYGIIIPISRQMIVNDDLGAIDQILGSAGDTVLVFENTTFFAMFNSNPTLNQDSTAVFATTHAQPNLSSTSDVPSVTSIGAARAALRRMKSTGGLFLNVPPAILLSGPTQETVIDQMVTAISPTLTTSVNPFSGRLRAVADANITDTSWYLFAEPGRVPNFVYGFLRGATGPRVRTEEPFGMQGVRVSLEHDFGCGAIDFRGGFRNPGA